MSKGLNESSSPDLIQCSKDEHEAMCAVMATLDPASFPGLTVAQRCALGRFAKPQGSVQEGKARGDESLSRAYINDLEGTLEQIANAFGVEHGRPEILIARCKQAASQLEKREMAQTPQRTAQSQESTHGISEPEVWAPSPLESIPTCIDNSLKRAAASLRGTGHGGDAIDASRLEFVRRMNALVQEAAGSVPQIECISFAGPSAPPGDYVRYVDHCAAALASQHQLLASTEDAARWRWIHPFLELESDLLYEFGTARYSLIYLKGDQIDLPPSPYYKDVIEGVDAARANARKSNG